jgi:hypothetical protein
MTGKKTMLPGAPARGRQITGNPVARSPLLRKGGVHRRSPSAERRRQRQALEAEVEKWRRDNPDAIRSAARGGVGAA